MIRVLIVSDVPWNTDNSFGNSYSNIFEGINDIEFANIYCNYGFPKNKVNGRYYQITEKTIIQNLLKPSLRTGKEISSFDVIDKLSVKQNSMLDVIKKKRWRIFFWIRRFIWRIGRWKSDQLKDFIDDFKPDLLFMPLYHSTYLNRVAQFVKQYSGKPMVVYVSDDVYTLKQFSFSPFYWLDRLITRRAVKKTVDQSEYIYVISSIQKQEYEKCFNKECRILTKGADFSGQPLNKNALNTPLKLVYTGNIGNGRWKTLALVGRAISRLNQYSVLVQLYIYSTTPMTKHMYKALNITNCVQFMGGIASEKVHEVQQNADLLVHVESLDLQERLQVRHSFSTKIVDYFHASRCILAVGTEDMASIEHIKSNNAGLVATNEDEIFKGLQKILASKQNVDQYVNNAWECGKRYHDISTIQKMIYNDLNQIKNKSMLPIYL